MTACGSCTRYNFKEIVVENHMSTIYGLKPTKKWNIFRSECTYKANLLLMFVLQGSQSIQSLQYIH